MMTEAPVQSITLHDARLEEIPAIAKHGHEFFEEGGLPGKFDQAVFLETWKNLIESRMGTLIVAMDGDVLAGTLGAIAYPDPNDGVVVGTEMFWFVRQEYRGGMTGLRLLKAFETWCKDAGCGRLGLVHLINLMPEKLHHLYTRMGYRAAEIHYFKEI